MKPNVQELSVSELSRALKRTVEDAYSYVRVRGEISGFKRAASGHMYMALKDQDAVLDGVCWRGSAGRLMVRPEDGLEIIATGRLTTYPGRSKYQIVIEQMELAGEGALLKLLEERRKRLAEEGLFDPDRKKPIPFLPEVIGVVTSPTGAVIRDILHRLADRFPRHVLLWPVLVQGDGAADQVTAAIKGFNAIAPGGPVPRPDVLIVARGGGSLEDLWSFNEENVVRAAAESDIPLISAVGHETDTTLIDHASDKRAPTPTAAAEMAVPVRAELMADLSGFTQRMIHAANRGLENRGRYLEGLARGLPQPKRLLETQEQRLDDLTERLSRAADTALGRRGEQLIALGARLRSPTDLILRAEESLSERMERLSRAVGKAFSRDDRRFQNLNAAPRIESAVARNLSQLDDKLDRAVKSVEALSYKGTLSRGYTVIRNTEGALVQSPDGLTSGEGLEIEFSGDRRLEVLVGKGAAAPKKSPKKKTPKKKPPVQKPAAAAQEELF